ncbi:MAG: hypothetical protein JXR73_05325, partial [Candidatus Omnitrophica bacterium]|nr:hypothetical protein [Candidatus Omnitrophota bacterium]
GDVSVEVNQVISAAPGRLSGAEANGRAVRKAQPVRRCRGLGRSIRRCFFGGNPIKIWRAPRRAFFGSAGAV